MSDNSVAALAVLCIFGAPIAAFIVMRDGAPAADEQQGLEKRKLRSGRSRCAAAAAAAAAAGTAAAGCLDRRFVRSGRRPEFTQRHHAFAHRPCNSDRLVVHRVRYRRAVQFARTAPRAVAARRTDSDVCRDRASYRCAAFGSTFGIHPTARSAAVSRRQRTAAVSRRRRNDAQIGAVL